MNKSDIKDLQKKLGVILNISLSIDGDYGPATKKAVKIFQKDYNLFSDGVAGRHTLAKLDTIYKKSTPKSNLLTLGKRRFVIFVDAGHSGISDVGEYLTSGKQSYHKNTLLHKEGHYYEGFENRLIAEAFIEQCTEAGIMCIRTYHPVQDWSLSKRVDIVKSYLRRGYYGYLHSFHSNAIHHTNSITKLNSTRGFMVFTTRGNDVSDVIAQIHFDNVDRALDGTWNIRANTSDGDSDFEANFQILIDKALKEFGDAFGSVLEEWGFHTSKEDCLFIVSAEGRKIRVECALKTAKQVKILMTRKIEANV